MTRGCAWPRSRPSGWGSPATRWRPRRRRATRPRCGALSPPPECRSPSIARSVRATTRRRLAAEVGLPCVVKPVSLSASRGVIRADDPRAAAAAAARVRAILAEAGEDPEGPLLIERYVPGAEVAVEGLLRAGCARAARGLRQAGRARGPVLRGDDLHHAVAAAGRDRRGRDPHDRGCLRGARAARGPRPRGAARQQGARVDARARGALDRRAVLALASLRRRCEPRGGDPAPRARAAARRPPPRGGGVGRDDAADPARGRAAGGARPGRRARRARHRRARDLDRPRPSRPPLPEGDRYLGFLFARGETPAQVEHALRAAHARLEIDIVEPAAGERSQPAAARG